MGDLIINANNVADGVEFEVGYRLYGSGGAFTFVVPNPTTFPVVIPNIPSGRYESSIKKKCANGVWSPVKYGVQDPCPMPLAFSAVREANNFKIVYQLPFGQTIFDVEITSPNGGIQQVRRTDGNSGEILIAINPFSEGEWRLRLRNVCDETAPNMYSDWTNYIDINVASSTPACGMVSAPLFSSITNNGFQLDATEPVNTSNVSAYTILYAPVGSSSYTSVTQLTPSWAISGLLAGTTYNVYVVTNCQGGGSSTQFFAGTVTTLI